MAETPVGFYTGEEPLRETVPELSPEETINPAA